MALPPIPELLSQMFPGPGATDLLAHRLGTPLAEFVDARGGETFRMEYGDDEKPRLEGYAKGDGGGGLGELTVVIFGADEDEEALDEFVKAVLEHLEAQGGTARTIPDTRVEEVSFGTFDEREDIFIETYRDGGPCVSINIGGLDSDYLPAETEQLSLADVQARLRELQSEES